MVQTHVTLKLNYGGFYQVPSLHRFIIEIDNSIYRKIYYPKECMQEVRFRLF
jgi:hypothetical protein